MAATCARFLRIRRFVITDFAYRHYRVSCTRLVGEDSTLRRTHIFQSLVVSRMPEHIKSRTHVCGLRLDDPCHRVVCCLVAHPKSFHLIACFTEHFSVFLTPSHHSVPHHHRLHPLHDREFGKEKHRIFANNTEGVVVEGKDRQYSRKGKKNRGGRRDRARHERKRLGTGWCDRFRGKREENVGIAPSPQQPQGKSKRHLQEEHRGEHQGVRSQPEDHASRGRLGGGLRDLTGDYEECDVRDRGDMLFAVACVAMEELDKAQKHQDRSQDEMEATLESVDTASGDFTNCWAHLNGGFREVSNCRALHEAACAELKKGCQRDRRTQT